ncbi:ATP-binding protein [Ferrimonas pelagia]|uniref:Histidine kinase/HSP90-like ATPase domain-containing protein n=1 Tax=Ferrimonas pelagia TaxID=1177826 RepID=A0ABP9FID1_9GAMM
MDRELKLEGQATYETVALIGKAISGMYHLTVLPAVDLDMVELAVVEIGNNTVEHAYQGEQNKTIWASFKYSKSSVSITVSDNGSRIPDHLVAGLDSVEIPEMDPDDPDTWNTSGRGFGIINQVMDEIVYFQDNGKNHFRMIKHVK